MSHYMLQCPECGSIEFNLTAGDGRGDHPFENAQVICTVICTDCRNTFVPSPEDWFEQEGDFNV